MGQQRSNTATRVRRQAGPSIFDCSQEILTSAEARHERFREQIGWVKTNNHGNGYYETWAVEILHKNYGGVFDIDGVFLNPVLMKVRSFLIVS